MEKLICIAETPLILQDEQGRDFRVEAGESVELTREQFLEVAAHVFAGEISDEDSAASEPETAPEPEPASEPEAETQPEAETAKPARTRKAKAE